MTVLKLLAIVIFILCFPLIASKDDHYKECSDEVLRKGHRTVLRAAIRQEGMLELKLGAKGTTIEEVGSSGKRVFLTMDEDIGPEVAVELSFRLGLGQPLNISRISMDMDSTTSITSLRSDLKTLAGEKESSVNLSDDEIIELYVKMLLNKRSVVYVFLETDSPKVLDLFAKLVGRIYHQAQTCPIVICSVPYLKQKVLDLVPEIAKSDLIEL